MNKSYFVIMFMMTHSDPEIDRIIREGEREDAAREAQYQRDVAEMDRQEQKRRGIAAAVIATAVVVGGVLVACFKKEETVPQH